MNPSINPLLRAENGLLLFVHIGDWHITQGQEQNYVDYLSIVAPLETEGSTTLDLVVLPGDNAGNGFPTQRDPHTGVGRPAELATHAMDPTADPLELTVQAIDARGRPGRHSLQETANYPLNNE